MKAKAPGKPNRESGEIRGVVAPNAWEGSY